MKKGPKYDAESIYILVKAVPSLGKLVIFLEVELGPRRGTAQPARNYQMENMYLKPNRPSIRMSPSLRGKEL